MKLLQDLLAYTVVHTLIKVEAVAVVYKQPHTFNQAKAKRFTETLKSN